MPHETDIACTWLVRHRTVQIVPIYPASTEARPPSFFVSQSWLAERLLLAGDIESNPGPKPTLTPFYTQNPPPTLTKYTNSSGQPSQSSPSSLSQVQSPHKSPTSVQNPSLTPYTLDLIQPTHPDSPHLLPSHKHPYAAVPTPPIPALYLPITTLPPTPAHCHTRNKQNTSKTKHKQIKILQLNANGIRNTVQELKHLIHTTQPDIITIQESKLTSASRTSQIPHFTAIRTSRKHKQGGGLITYIKSDTIFTHIKTPQVINTEIQLLKIHTKHFKDITIANIYIAPRNTTT